MLLVSHGEEQIARVADRVVRMDDGRVDGASRSAMPEGDVTWVGLVLSLSLVAVAIALSLREQLRLERDMVVAVLRSVAQLLIVAAGLTLVVDESTPLFWSWLWVAGIVIFAAGDDRAPRPAAARGRSRSASPPTRSPRRSRSASRSASGSSRSTAARSCPIAGMVVGNSMKSCVVVVQLLAEQAADRRDEIEARLALGLPGAAAIRADRAPVAARSRSRRRSRTSRRWGSSSCPAR